MVYKFKSVNDSQDFGQPNVGDFYETRGVAFKRGFFKNDFLSYIQYFSKDLASKASEEILTSTIAKYRIPIRCVHRKHLQSNYIKPFLKQPTLYTSSGLNLNYIHRYHQVCSMLIKKNSMHLKNPTIIYETLNYLITRPYGIPLSY